MIVIVLIAAIIVVGFVIFFWLEIKHDIDKIDLNFYKNYETHERYKNKQKQLAIQQALFDKIRKERKIKSEQETAQIDVQKISSI